MTKQKTVLVVNGPNLQMLGLRQVEIYGKTTLSEIIASLAEQAQGQPGLQVADFQSNSEGQIVDFLNERFTRHHQKTALVAGLVVNAASLSHTSIAIRDAIEMYTQESVPFVEVHLSNVFRREQFRHHSHLSALADAVITGLGPLGYKAAMSFILAKQEG